MTCQTFRGNGSVITLDEDCIKIMRCGAMGAIAHSPEVKIPLTSIQTVAYRKGSIFANGFLRFSALGIGSDLSTVFFFPGGNSDALQFKEHVERQMEVCRAKVAQHVPQSVNLPLSAADEIQKFKALLDAGVITQEEFNAKKKQLLDL